MENLQNPVSGQGKTHKNTAPKGENMRKHHAPVETLEAFEKRTQPGRERVALSDIHFPQKTGNMSSLRFALRVVDILCISVVILLSVWNAYVGINQNSVIAPLAAGISGAFGFIMAMYIVKAHQFSPAESYGKHISRVLLGSAAALGVWLSFALIFKPLTFLPDSLAISGLMATGVLVVLHSMYFISIKKRQKAGDLIPTIVMLGATESARRLIEENARTRELNILAIFDERLSRAPHNIHGVPVVGRIQDMLEWEALPYVDSIIVTLPEMAQARKKVFVEQIRKLPNRIAFVVDEFEQLDTVKQRITQIAEIGMRDIAGKPKSGRHTFMKRMVDVSISGTALLLGLPVLLLVAVLIKLDSKGPVFFKQKRHGFNNRVFEVYKFRSLNVADEDKDAKSQVVAGDSRVTKVGRIIRKTSIDELPQLLNVLKGDMSLVGPRPHAVGMHTGETETYKLVEDYAHRHKMKPGLTGWAQINGSRGPLHDAASVQRRVQLDMEYIERSSVFFDIMIMLKTLPCLLGDKDNVR
ncbi:MAG: hypothetical protein COA43_12945 [Robiginitomaculum sp.]|nr:MAG: hypothetical protein COA43_12945 [Robiginitomaculum sp.]